MGETKSISQVHRTRRQQIIREAEGYLEFLMACDEFGPPANSVRDRVAQRVVDSLSRLDHVVGHRAHIRFLKGRAFQIMERYPEAIECLEEASELDPENIHIWLALGWCHKRNGRIDLAINALEEALHVDNHEAIVHYNLACYLSLANEPGRSLHFLSRAFEIDPNYRRLVGRESDFDNVRNHPTFQNLTQSTIV